jgi:hypothetical protein
LLYKKIGKPIAVWASVKPSPWIAY